MKSKPTVKLTNAALDNAIARADAAEKALRDAREEYATLEEAYNALQQVLESSIEVVTCLDRLRCLKELRT